MLSLAEFVPIPPGINPSLSACREDTMLDKFGKPGALTDKCSAVEGNVRTRIRYGVDVGPFKISGLNCYRKFGSGVLGPIQRTS